VDIQRYLKTGRLVKVQPRGSVRPMPTSCGVSAATSACGTRAAFVDFVALSLNQQAAASAAYGLNAGVCFTAGPHIFPCNRCKSLFVWQEDYFGGRGVKVSDLSDSR
jgi:hypothetical protein